MRVRRKTLTDSVGEALEDAMRKGRFGAFLPSEVKLAESLGVSRVTLRAALEKLAERGRITRGRGRRTRIVAEAADTAPRPTTGRLIFLSPNRLHELPPGVLLVLDLLRARLEERGLTLEHRHCHAFALAEPAQALEKLTLAERADAYLLHLAPSRAQAWFADRGLPAVVVGTPVATQKLSGVHTDLLATARHATRQLIRAGHAADAIGLLIPDLDLPDNAAVEAGFQEAGGRAAKILRHPADPERLRPWMTRRDLLRHAGATTAMVVVWPGAALSLVGTLAFRRTLEIPRELSVVCLYDDPAFRMMVPDITRYSRPPERYVAILTRLVLQTLAGGARRRPVTRTLFPTLLRGETLAAPPK